MPWHKEVFINFGRICRADTGADAVQIHAGNIIRTIIISQQIISIDENSFLLNGGSTYESDDGFAGSRGTMNIAAELGRLRVEQTTHLFCVFFQVLPIVKSVGG